MPPLNFMLILHLAANDLIRMIKRSNIPCLNILITSMRSK